MLKFIENIILFVSSVIKFFMCKEEKKEEFIRVWEDENGFQNHPEIRAEYDEDSEEYFKLIPYKDDEYYF